MKRVNLVEGFVADFHTHDILLNHISEYEEVDENGNKVLDEEGNTIIKERVVCHGSFGTMDNVIKRFREELTKRKLKDYQDLKEYVKVVREVVEVERELIKLVNGR